ncbi:MAG: response regulator transcription factor [Bacillota bacterium]
MRHDSVLVVEDDARLAEMLSGFLKDEGFKVSMAHTGEAALAQCAQQPVDLIVLDLMLPGAPGLEVLRELRRHEPSPPVIILTARAEEADKLVGLELGADDYVTKPFSPRELAARIRTVLRRAREGRGKGDIIRQGDIQVDLAKFEASLGGCPLGLTPTEFKLLALLAQNPGRVFTRLQLLDVALGHAYEGYERSIDTHISNLRRKLEPQGEPTYIQTVHGVGYRFAGKGP